MLRCNDNKIYTGYSFNLERRLRQHRKGEVSFTKTRLPVELVTYVAFTDKLKAYDFERYLKSGSGKAFANKRFL